MVQELTERKLRLLNREGVGAEESDTTLNEVEEELVHSQIKIAIARSYREIRTIEREIPLLDRMLELEKDPKRAQAEREAHARLVATVRPLPPFSLLSSLFSFPTIDSLTDCLIDCECE